MKKRKYILQPGMLGPDEATKIARELYSHGNDFVTIAQHLKDKYIGVRKGKPLTADDWKSILFYNPSYRAKAASTVVGQRNLYSMPQESTPQPRAAEKPTRTGDIILRALENLKEFPPDQQIKILKFLCVNQL